MAQVSVTIDGKIYRMACDEGQEEHLLGLAERFDRYVGHLKEQFGEIGDQRLTVMAGIMVTDELSELQSRLSGVEAELADLKATRDDVLARVERNEEALGGALSSLAGRMESVATSLTVRS